MKNIIVERMENRKLALAGLVAMLVISGTCLGFAQNTRRPVAAEEPDRQSGDTAGISREQADAILQELRQIRHLLESDVQAASATPTQQPTRQVRTARVPDTYVLGKRDAPVTLIEFMDYQCPFCRQFQQNVFSELKKEYIDKGKVRFISLDMPLGFHPNALPAAEASRCAGEQGKYWEMRDTLISHSDDLARSSLLKYAQQIGLDSDKLASCVDSQKYKSAIQKDTETALSLSVSGTPSFIIAKTERDELVGDLIIGNVSFTTFEAELKPLLDTQRQASGNQTSGSGTGQLASK